MSSDLSTLKMLADSAAQWSKSFCPAFPELSLGSVDAILQLLRNADSSTGIFADAVGHLGAWLGRQLTSEGDAWVGLGEASPPRVQLGDRFYSPFDEVSRRLHPALPYPERTLSSLVGEAREQFANWVMEANSQQETNKAAWRTLADDQRFAITTPPKLSREQANASLDPWLRSDSVAGRDVLCLAAGGGTHGPILCSAGARVTVVDQCEQLLEIDKQYAREHDARMQCCVADMHDLGQISTASQDVVLQPVSTSYSHNLTEVFSEVARVLRPGGRYVSQHKSPTALQATESAIGVAVSIRQGAIIKAKERGIPHLREAGCCETAHSYSAIVGGICSAGFVIEDFQEPCHADSWAQPGSMEFLAQYCPPYFKVNARLGQ